MVLRKLTIFIILLLACGSYQAYSQGVFYHDGRIYDALATASAKKKLLIVEFLSQRNYRSAWMNKMINSSPKVVAKLNDEFVVYQINTRTKEGAGFAVTYSVTNYPTLIIFNEQGDPISKIEKNMDPDEFIQHLDKVVFNTDGAAVWRIQQILTAAENMQLDQIPLLFNNLLARFGDRMTDKHFWPIFKNNTITFYYSPSFGYLLANINAFRQSVGEYEVMQAVEQKLGVAVMANLTSGNNVDMLIVNDLKAIVDSVVVEDSEKFRLAFEMIDNKLAGDAGHYLINYSKLRGMMAEDSGLSLAMSLGFVAEIGTREQKQRAKKLLEREILLTSISSQVQLLQNLIDRF